jgi:hypothetical protein
MIKMKTHGIKNKICKPKGAIRYLTLFFKILVRTGYKPNTKQAILSKTLLNKNRRSYFVQNLFAHIPNEPLNLLFFISLTKTSSIPTPKEVLNECMRYLFLSFNFICSSG